MAEETEIKKILEIVQGLQGSFIDLREDVSSLKEDVSGLKEDVSGLKEDVSGLKETVEFMQDNMATKEDIAHIRAEMATKEDLALLKSEVFEHIDGFAQQNQKFDLELIAAQAKFDRVEERVEVLELKAGIGA